MKLNPQDHDRPISLDSPMIRAVLSGTKTQMRLVADIPPFRVEYDNCYDLPHGWMGSYPDGEAPEGATRKPWFIFDDNPGMDGLISCMHNRRKPTPTAIRISSPQNYWNKNPKHAMEELVLLCPLGRKGDTLWVRETWGVHTRSAGGRLTSRPGGWLGLGYQADELGSGHILDVDLEHTYWIDPPEPMWDHYRKKSLWQRWRAPLQMPRWAARLILRIDKVKLERLQDITEADAVAEGSVQTFTEKAERAEPGIKVTGAPYSVECFRQEWNNLHEKTPGHLWGDNPHVWAVTFTVEKCPLEIGEMK